MADRNYRACTVQHLAPAIAKGIDRLRDTRDSMRKRVMADRVGRDALSGHRLLFLSLKMDVGSWLLICGTARLLAVLLADSWLLFDNSQPCRKSLKDNRESRLWLPT